MQPLAYVYVTFGISGFIGLVLWAVLVAIFTAVIVWLLTKFCDLPGNIAKLIYLAAILYVLLGVYQYIRYSTPGPIL